MTAPLEYTPEKIERLLRNLRETSPNEGSVDLACRCVDALGVITQLQQQVADLTAERDAKQWYPFQGAGNPECDAQVAAERDAIAKAALEAAANECERMMMYPGGRQESFAHHGVQKAASAIRRIDPATIVASVKGKSC